jgi:cyanophycin synthetase
VKLKPTGSNRSLGAAVDRTDHVHPDNARVARLVAQVVGLNIAGIDIVTPDISESMLMTGGVVLDVNHGPGLNLHLYPAEGQPRDVGASIIDMFFPPGQPVRAPVIAVTAAAETSPACHLIAHTLAMAGRSVGLATREGLVVDGFHLANAESANPAGPRTLLDNPLVEVAVVEVDAGAELGFDSCDVAVVSSLSGVTTPSGEPVERFLLAILDAEGVAVFNADDPSTAALSSEIEREAVLFGRDAGAPVIQEHVARGGRAVMLQQGQSGATISLLAGGSSWTIWEARKDPIDPDSQLEVASAGVLAAVAAAIAFGIPVETIREAVQTFRYTAPEHIPKMEFPAPCATGGLQAGR